MHATVRTMEEKGLHIIYQNDAIK